MEPEYDRWSGIDLVDLEEFIFYCRAQPRPLQHFAARWAAREGEIKALGIPEPTG
jgi:phosphopantetheinyl transferase (holo-ACP synthase)